MENKENNITVKRKLPPKVIVAVIIAFLLLISGAVLAFANKAPDVELIDGFYVTVNERGSYAIIGLDGTQSSTTLLIPETLGDRTVDEIAGGAFSGSRMKNFIVPTTIEYIGKNAFDGEGVFYIYMVGRKDLSGMTVDENWSGAGEVIFQDVRPQINTRPDIKEVEDFTSNTSRPSTDLVIEGELPFDESLLENPDFTTDFDTQNPSFSKDDEATKKSPMDRIEIVTPPTKTEYVEGQVFDTKGMLVKAIYEDGFSQLVSGYVYSKELLSVNVRFVTITYSDSGITKTAIQPISVALKQPVKLSVKTPPEKVNYVEGQSFVPDGMIAIAEYNNGETRTVEPKYEETALKLAQPNVELTYAENGAKVRVNQSITVIKKVPDKLTIKTPATKTAYIEGNIFDKTGLTLEITDNDGERKEVTDYTYPKEKLLFGETEAELTYTREGVTVKTFQLITVRKRLPTKLEIVTPPDKTLYIEDLPFDSDGLTTRATYDNGDVEFVSPKFQKEDLIFGQTEVKLSYEENTGEVDVTQAVTVIKKTPTKLFVDTQPDKRTYSAGLKFKPKGLKVKALYDNEKNYDVIGYTYSDMRLTHGQKAVTLTHKENGATVTTDVPITVDAQMAIYEKHICDKSHCFICTGAGKINTIAQCNVCNGTGRESYFKSCPTTVTTTFHCGLFQGSSTTCSVCTGVIKSEDIPCGQCFGTGNVTALQTCTSCNGIGVTGSVTNCADCSGRGITTSKGDYIIDVVAIDGSLPDNGEHSDGFWYVKKQEILDENYVSVLKVTTNPSKTSYIEEEVFNPDGMTVTLIPSDSEIATVIVPDYPTEEIVYGQRAVTVTYSDENGNKAAVDVPIKVAKRKPVSLAVKKSPQRVSYIEELDFLKYGMIVEATYDNGKTHEVTGYTFTPKVAFGQSLMDVFYKENGTTQMTSQPITVIKKSPAKLTLTKPLYVDKYIKNEHFDLNEAELTVIYDNETEAIVTPSYEDNPLTVGQTKVTVNYEENNKEVQLDLPVSVVVNVPSKLNVIKQPSKTSYSAGLKFRPNGMVVEAEYPNGKKLVTTSYSFPDERLLLKQSAVKLTENDNLSVTTNVPVNVGAAQAVYEKHVCDLTTDTKCNGNGKINTIVRCSRCSGSGRITTSSTCGSCGGSGGRYESNRCTGCGGDGQINHACGGWCADCQGETISCSSCGGSGGSGSSWRSCGRCGGSGSTSSTSTCYNCSGSGQTGSIVTCSNCSGRGKIGNKGNFITDTVAVDGSLPNNGEHSDGFWYVRKRAILDKDYISTLMVTSPPTKTAYIEGQIFEAAGMVVKLIPMDSENGEVVTPNYPTEPLTLGQQFVTATYTDEGGNNISVDQPVTVIKKKLTEINIIAPPEKTEYIENTNFVSFGMVVKATYDNGVTEEINGYTFTPKVILGQTAVEISYEENGVIKKASQPITVVKKKPIKLTVTKVGYTEKYLEDEKFDLRDTEVVVTYDNEEEKVITPTFDDIPLIKGQTSVKLSYKENDTSVSIDAPISVFDKAPIAIKVTKQPNKITYSAGLKFNPEGMIIVALHLNDMEMLVTDYTVPDQRLTQGQTHVVISYKGQGVELNTDLPITVGSQMALYEKSNITKVTCGICNGSGRVPSYRKCTACNGAGDVNCSNSDCPFGGGWHACDVCKGSGQMVSGQTACYSCLGTGKIDGKGSYISDVAATSGSLPVNGKHSDGFWYVKKKDIVDYDNYTVKTSPANKPESQILVTYEKFTPDGSIKIGEVTAQENALPTNGKHTDGYYYRKKA